MFSLLFANQQQKIEMMLLPGQTKYVTQSPVHRDKRCIGGEVTIKYHAGCWNNNIGEARFKAIECSDCFGVLQKRTLSSTSSGNSDKLSRASANIFAVFILPLAWVSISRNSTSIERRRTGFRTFWRLQGELHNSLTETTDDAPIFGLSGFTGLLEQLELESQREIGG